MQEGAGMSEGWIRECMERGRLLAALRAENEQLTKVLAAEHELCDHYAMVAQGVAHDRNCCNDIAGENGYQCLRCQRDFLSTAVEKATKRAEEAEKILRGPSFAPGFLRCQKAESDLAAAREEAGRLRAALAESYEIGHAVYVAVHREGWEPGPTRSEAVDRLHSWLCNAGRDPNGAAR
jgi:hypothetical protein